MRLLGDWRRFGARGGEDVAVQPLRGRIRLDAKLRHERLRRDAVVRKGGRAIAGTFVQAHYLAVEALLEWIDRKWFGATATKLKKPKSKAGQRGPGGAKHQAQHQL